MKYILNDDNFVTNIVIETIDTNAIEADRGVGRIGDYYSDGVFYSPTDSDGKILDTETLTYSYDETTLEDKKTALIKKIESYCDKLDAKDFEYPEGSGLYYKMTAATLNTIMRCIDMDDTDTIPCNSGCWDTSDGETSTAFTVGELKALYNYGYDIPAANYINKNDHIAAVEALETVEEVVEYDYKTGWSNAD